MRILEELLLVSGDDYTTGCLLDYFYFKENHKLIATDLSKLQVLNEIQEQSSKFRESWKYNNVLHY